MSAHNAAINILLRWNKEGSGLSVVSRLGEKISEPIPYINPHLKNCPKFIVKSIITRTLARLGNLASRRWCGDCC